jgi:hypothetical protein
MSPNLHSTNYEHRRRPRGLRPGVVVFRLLTSPSHRRVVSVLLLLTLDPSMTTTPALADTCLNQALLRSSRVVTTAGEANHESTAGTVACTTYGYDAASSRTTPHQFVATKPAAGARLPQDVNVNPNSPGVLPTSGRSIGRASHNAAVANDVAAARAAGATDIRVNQQQVNAAGQRVGVNRPDLQYTLPNGERVYIEYEGVGNPRGAAHTTRITANDPSAQVTVKIVP